jgi:hypothetical protein
MRLKGTVFSGHPTRTSWGNTMRMVSCNYGMAKAFGFLPYYHCFQAGDDTLEIIEREHLATLLDAIK